MNAFFSLLLALVLIFPGSPTAHPPAAENAAYYIILRQAADGSLEAVGYCQLVTLSAPLETMSSFELIKSLSGKAQGYIARLVDEAKQVRYQTTVSLPNQLRGEFQPDPQQPIQGHFLPLKTAEFVLRVPAADGTRLVLSRADGKYRAEFSLSELGCDAARSKTTYPVLPIQLNGSPQNRLDLVILGDGYTAAEAGKFNNDAMALANNFFNISPLFEYKSYFNIYAIYAPSIESGADHPPYNAACTAGDTTCCGDSQVLSDPQYTQTPQLRSTIFESTYCYYNIYRLVVATNTVNIYAVAASLPDWDAAIVIVNDSIYGGSGGFVSVVSTHNMAVEIAKHEFGHSFGLLADEYDSPGPVETCDDSDAESYNDCAANVTNVYTPDQIKWKHWIQPGTPIPTTTSYPNYQFVTGLFKGALYDPNNYYRPGYNCLMRNLSQPFCQVPSEAIVMRLYQGGWGTPYEGISMIEPGTELPATSTVNLYFPGSQTFQATILQPIVPIATDWMIDGVVQAGQNGNSFVFTPSLPGTYTITLRVQDNGPLVHPVIAGTNLIFTQDWIVTVGIPLFLPVTMK